MPLHSHIPVVFSAFLGVPSQSIHAFSLRPSAAPASEFHGAHHGHAAQVSQVAQPAYLFHETRPFSQLVHLLFADTEPLSRKTTRRSDCIPVSPSLTRCRPSKPRRTFITCAPPRARSSCPTVPLSELPDPHLRMVEDFVSLARPLATTFRLRPSSSSPTTFKRDGGPFQFLICVRGVVEMVCSLCDWPWV